MSTSPPALSIGRGRPLPLGATVLDGGTQFALFSRHASAVTLLLFEDGEATQPAVELPLCREEHRTGDIWHGLVEGVGAGWCYLYRVDGPFAPAEGHRFDPARPLFDPYAKAFTGGLPARRRAVELPAVGPRCVVVRDDFDWAGDRHPRHPLQHSLIYELHVRGFTVHPSAGVAHPGTDLGRIAVLHGGLSDTEQQRVVEDFGNSQRAVRLLLCSDIASEGINLHHQCHRLIHFDLPWSLMVFAQRNGRIDRYGQARTPRIVYLVTDSSNTTIRGDTRVLEVLREKDEQAYQNIGDPSVFMGVHDVAEEEMITQNAIADRKSAEAFDERLTPAPSEGDKLLALFLGDDAAADPPAPDPAMPPAPLSLFKDELDYCATALDRLRRTREADASTDDPLLASAARVRFTVNREARTLTLDAPDDLAARFSYLPPEVLPASRRFVLTTDRARVQAAIAESRRSESTWPSAHYLWRLNPVVEWLNDRVLAAFGRFEAPILAGIPGLQRRETVLSARAWYRTARVTHCSTSGPPPSIAMASSSNWCRSAPSWSALASEGTRWRIAASRSTWPNSRPCYRMPWNGRGLTSVTVATGSKVRSTSSWKRRSPHWTRFARAV